MTEYVRRPVSRAVGRPSSAPAAPAPFRTPVRGHRFAAKPPAASEPSPGQRAELVRERSHPIDRWAVAVWVQDTASGVPWRVGYLDRAVAARLAPQLDDGLTLEVRIDGWWPEPGGRWKRPVVRIGPVPRGGTRPIVRRDDTAREPAARRRLWGMPARSVRRVVPGPG